MRGYIDSLMDLVKDDDIQDRTDQVKAQNERLATDRNKNQERGGKMATPLRPTKETQKASETYSEPTRRIQ